MGHVVLVHVTIFLLRLSTQAEVAKIIKGLSNDNYGKGLLVA